MSSNLSGRAAEFAACQFLRLKGYRLIAHNYITGRGTGAGEIDLIMQKQKTLVFIEVKKRQNLETAAYAILSRQQERIRRAAEVFIATHSQYAGYDVQFDAVLVENLLKLEHIENAF